MESVNVVVNDTNDLFEFSKEELISSLIDDADEDQTVEIFDKSNAGPSDSVATETDQVVSSRKTKDDSKHILTDPIRKELSSMVKKNHPSKLILGDPNEGMVTRKKYMNHAKYVCEPKNVKETLLDEFWIKSMHKELEQFSRNNIWTLVPRPENTNVVGTKWIFKNKFDEFGNIVRNKARLVA